MLPLVFAFYCMAIVKRPDFKITVRTQIELKISYIDLRFLKHVKYKRNALCCLKFCLLKSVRAATCQV